MIFALHNSLERILPFNNYNVKQGFLQVKKKFIFWYLQIKLGKKYVLVFLLIKEWCKFPWTRSNGFYRILEHSNRLSFFLFENPNDKKNAE